MEDLSLIKLDAARLAIETASTVQEVKDTLDMLAAAKVYASQKKLGKEIQLRVSEYVVRAERKLGETLEAAKATGQITHAHKPNLVVPDENNKKFTLEEAGIDRKLSSRAQRLANIPKENFEKEITNQKATGKLSPNSIMRSGKNGSKSKSQKSDAAPQRHGRANEVMALYDQGLSKSEIIAATGLREHQIRHITERERIRREGERQAKGGSLVETLSPSDRQKIAVAIEQEKRKVGEELRAKFYQEVHAHAKTYLGKMAEQLQNEQDRAKHIMEHRKGFMNRGTYKLILSCLHPDRILDSRLKVRYEEAFREFARLEKFVLCEKDSPTEFIKIPKTQVEWDAAKREAVKARKGRQATDKLETASYDPIPGF